MAHDLGHPPFGHIAEEELDQLVRDAGVPDGYEGNAQSFRIVVRLANSDALSSNDLPIQGLNLTRETLNGVLKYPWLRGGHRDYADKWGCYETEREVFRWVRQSSRPRQRSLIAEIMDWADDITFAIHDLLDFYRAGRILIDRCKGSNSAERALLLEGIFSRKPKWRKQRQEYEEALASIVDQFPFDADQRFTDSPDVRIGLSLPPQGFREWLSKRGKSCANQHAGPPARCTQIIGGRIRTAKSPRSPGRPQRPR